MMLAATSRDVSGRLLPAGTRWHNCHIERQIWLPRKKFEAGPSRKNLVFSNLCSICGSIEKGANLATIRRVDRSGTPSPFTSHIIIERVMGGFQASGAAVVNLYTKHLSSVVYRSYDDALRLATSWAIEHGIPEIFVVDADGSATPAGSA